MLTCLLVFLWTKQLERSTLQNVSLAKANIPGVVSCWQRICYQGKRRRITRLWMCKATRVVEDLEHFPPATLGPKRVKELLWYKSALGKGWTHASYQLKTLFILPSNSVVTFLERIENSWQEAKKELEKVRVESRTLGYCFCLPKFYALLLLSNGNKFLSMFFSKSRPPLLSLCSAARVST